MQSRSIRGTFLRLPMWVLVVVAGNSASAMAAGFDVDQDARNTDLFEEELASWDTWEDSQLYAKLRSADFAKRRQAETVPTVFARSGQGPGPGRSVWSLGGRAYVPTTDVIIPLALFELGYVRGISKSLDFELRLETLGVGTLVEFGAKWRVAGDHRVSLSLRGDLAGGMLLLGGSGGFEAGVATGATLGAFLSTGSEQVQLTAGLDLPMLLGVGGFDGLERGPRARGWFLYALRPHLGVEIGLGNQHTLLVQGTVWTSPETGFLLPSLGAGLAW